MGEITDALRRAKQGQNEPRAERHTGDQRPDRFGASEATRILDEAQRSAQRVEAERQRSLPTLEAAKQLEPTPDPDSPRPQGVRISTEQTGEWHARTVIADRRGGLAEAYRHFAIRLARELVSRQARSVMLVSALRHEGKSTTCCNLALALASMAGGRRTALLDLDLRRPSVGPYLGASPMLGVDGVLRGKHSLAEAQLATDIPSLDLYPVAEPMSDPHEVLAGPRLPAMMAELESAYDTVVVDSPPLLLVPDGHLLFPHIGGLVAVMRSRQTRRGAFEQMIEQMPAGLLIGSLINDTRAPRHTDQYGYYLDATRDDSETEEESED